MRSTPGRGRYPAALRAARPSRPGHRTAVQRISWNEVPFTHPEAPMLMMTRMLLVLAAAGSLLLTGCVTQSAYKDAVQKMESSYKQLVVLTKELEQVKRQAEADLKAMRKTQDWLGGELMKAQHLASQRQTELESTEYHLSRERELREEAERRMVQLELEREKLGRVVIHLEDQLDQSFGRLTRVQTAQGRVSSRLESLKEERSKLLEKLREAQSQVQILDALMAVDRQASGLRVKPPIH